MVTEDKDLKFGVPRVHKADFNANPDRYELRKGFPDMPACPYGNSWSALGYDKEPEPYVWLVSSILKDERLMTKEF